MSPEAYLTTMSPLRIIFAGSGEFGLPTLRAVLDAGHEVIQVFSQPDRPAGRGKKLTPTPIAQFALERGLPLMRTDNINREPLPPADLMLVIAFGQKIADPVIHHPRLGSINLHASRLPRYRGAAPINWAIIRGETVAGNSIIRLAQKMDAGAVLGMSAVPIEPTETAGELHDRLSQDGAGLTLKVIEQLATGTAVETPQDESAATLAPKMNRELSRIDWNRPASEIACQIRGMYPWPGCRVQLTDTQGTVAARLTLVRATVDAGHEGDRWHPGEIMMDGCICAGVGGVRILEVQPEGKRPMPLDAYQRGNPWCPGMRLEPLT